MPVFALALPVPSSASVTSTVTSLVDRVIRARLGAPRFVRMLDVATFFLAGICEHTPHGFDEGRILISRSHCYSQRARDELGEVAHEHAGLGKLLPERGSLTRRAEQDEVGVRVENFDARNALELFRQPVPLRDDLGN